MEIGSAFGRLTVLSVFKMKRRIRCKCRCECGKVFTTSKDSVLRGATKSCGCLRREFSGLTKTTHGMCHTKVYKVWKSMRRRCSNPKEKGYSDYGGRGIRVCERWESFPNFLEDMGDLPAPGYTIERANNEGHYEPSNCEWIERRLQGKNTRRSKFLTINGERRIVADWARISGVKLGTLWTRLYAGWTPEEAISPHKRKNAYC